ncbi:MAG: hypothetical protein JWN99_2412 [Ilumatobacteraceae bacterium]|nr:hypothetical protein [Ilumatobacteraceae bacterium]
MSDESFAQGWADAWNSHDVDRIRGMFTDDAIYEDVPFGMVEQGPAVTELFRGNFRTFGADFRVDDVTANIDGDKGYVRWTMSGTQIGDMGGKPTKGKHFSQRGVSIIELRDGRIARNCDYWDGHGSLIQLGHIDA